MRFALTPGHTHDTKTVEQMAKALKGWIFGDKGYLSQSLSETLKQQGLLLFTRVRKNMKEKIMTPLLCKFIWNETGKRSPVEWYECTP